MLVTDGTDIAAAQAATASAPTGRFVWLAQQGEVLSATEQVLTPLLETSSG